VNYEGTFMNVVVVARRGSERVICWRPLLLLILGVCLMGSIVAGGTFFYLMNELSVLALLFGFFGPLITVAGVMRINLNLPIENLSEVDQ